MNRKDALKQILGELPFAPELYWQLRQSGGAVTRNFSFHRTEMHLPGWKAAVESSLARIKNRDFPAAKKVFIFATLPYWIEHSTLFGMALAGLGHKVTLAYLPYPNWRVHVNRFDLRRHNAYSQKVLAQAEPYIQTVSFVDSRGIHTVPNPLYEAIRRVSERDVQYTLQVEDVDLQGDLYQLRIARNNQAATSALTWLYKNHPDIVLTPNGSILEMGAVYQAARYLDIPVVTYEFGEQRERIWLARDAEVMFQDTRDLWQFYKNMPLSEEQMEQVRTLFASRQRADLWENFSRRWQGIPSQGGERVRAELGLDASANESRPVVLLAANVVGDSLTLGRQVFSRSMTEWLERTVAYFAEHPEAQLLIRIHPGERYTKGPSVSDVVRRVLPEIPEHIHLVAAEEKINTYDLIQIANLGLVYTTTVGMEMAMSGVPVLVAGQTHYREKGFTLDPNSWEAYFQTLDQVLKATRAQRLTHKQVETARSYAYRFFFDFPHPFPWHLLHIWDDLKIWPLDRVLSDEGQELFRETFDCLMGAPMDWMVNPAVRQSVEGGGLA